MSTNARDLGHVVTGFVRVGRSGLAKWLTGSPLGTLQTYFFILCLFRHTVKCMFVKTAAVFVLKIHIVKWVHNGRLFWQMLCPRGLLAFPLFVVLGLMLITARDVLGYWPCTRHRGQHVYTTVVIRHCMHVLWTLPKISPSPAVGLSRSPTAFGTWCA